MNDDEYPIENQNRQKTTITTNSQITIIPCYDDDEENEVKSGRIVEIKRRYIKWRKFPKKEMEMKSFFSIYNKQ